MTSAEVVSTIYLPSGKDYPGLSALPNIGVDGSAMIGGAPYIHVDELTFDGFIDESAMDGWLPGDIPLERTCHWSLKNNVRVKMSP